MSFNKQTIARLFGDLISGVFGITSSSSESIPSSGSLGSTTNCTGQGAGRLPNMTSLWNVRLACLQLRLLAPLVLTLVQCFDCIKKRRKTQDDELIFWLLCSEGCHTFLGALTYPYIPLVYRRAVPLNQFIFQKTRIKYFFNFQTKAKVDNQLLLIIYMITYLNKARVTCGVLSRDIFKIFFFVQLIDCEYRRKAQI